MAAIQVIRDLEAENRDATPQETAVLAQFRSWGATPNIFDPKRPAARADDVREALSPDEWKAARRTILNAHFTSPELTNSIWQAVQATGFTSGTVIEPGCGSGNFLASAPQGCKSTGIELDPISAQVAAARVPDAQIRCESFADTAFDSDVFDLGIGNVPFAKTRLLDPEHNPDRKLSIHNHFLVKTTDLVRPGGVVAMLTSRFTMDALDDTARRRLHDQADLIAALRLPTGAHAKEAGTDAVTDLLILRKRMPGEDPRSDAWVNTAEHPDLGEHVNTWWIEHPESVLGEMQLGKHGLYGSNELIVSPTHGDLPAALQQTATRLIIESGMSFEPVDAPVVMPTAREKTALVPGISKSEGHISRQSDGFKQVASGELIDLKVPKTASREMDALIALRDLTVDVLDQEANSREDTDALAEARRSLRQEYEAYTRSFGPINRVKVSTSQRRNKEGDLIVTRRVPTAVRIFRDDPRSTIVRALEKFDAETQTATGADILYKRVLHPRTAPVVQNIDDALAVSLNRHGKPDLEVISSLLEISEDQARKDLGDRVFECPATEELVTREAYLSGHVRQKLRRARAAREDDPKFQANVEALIEVQPRDLVPAEITPAFGASWIPAGDVQDFLRSIGDRSAVVERSGSDWYVKSPDNSSSSCTMEWGTEAISAGRIVEKLCKQQGIEIREEVDGKSVLDAVATAEAQTKADLLRSRFATWCFEDEDRSQRLVADYNEKFNSLVHRNYDSAGDELDFPGLVSSFVPRQHQRAGVARMINEPATALFHSVGAGKTATMVIGTMEMRRLGISSKPAIIVPNHMLEQFSREWLQLYPAANILAAGTDDLAGDKRRTFVARAATGEWDAVILTQGAFQRLDVGQEAKNQFMEKSLEQLEDRLNTANSNGESRTVRRIEMLIAAQEQNLREALSRVTDAGTSFGQIGFTSLTFDEAHMLKNAETQSHNSELANPGSQRAIDAEMKMQIVREQGGRIVLATATPISNSLTEAYVMQRFLRPDLLEKAGVAEFDSWAATFAQAKTAVEMKPAGDGFRLKTRFSTFHNTPEMLDLLNVAADIRTMKDLDLPVPLIKQDKDGRRAPETVAVPMSEQQEVFQSHLAQRAESCSGKRAEKGADNLLVVTSDGRKAGLDTRLVTNRTDDELSGEVDEPRKVEAAAQRMLHIWERNKHNRYTDSEKLGALQIVFCDMGTPKGGSEEFDAYTALRDELASGGMDPKRVRFIHEAKTDADKARLFASCRDGEVDVIVGSTAKMGVGTNIQKRAVALHHLDCAWTWASIEQREGRIIRSGNENPEVEVIRWVTEGSFDGYMWQTVARKAQFANQVLSGSVKDRVVKDLSDDEALSLAEITAIASGNPIVLEHAQAKEEVDRLVRLAAAHEQSQRAISFKQESAKYDLNLHKLRLRELEKLAQMRSQDKLDVTNMTVDGRRFEKRSELAEVLSEKAMKHVTRASKEADSGIVFDGVELMLDKHRRIEVSGVSWTFVESLNNESLDIKSEELTALGQLTRLENFVNGIPEKIDHTKGRIVSCERELMKLKELDGVEFDGKDDLAAARAELARVEEIMNPKVVEAEEHSESESTSKTPSPDQKASSVNERPALDTEEMRDVMDTLKVIRPVKTYNRPRSQEHTSAANAADMSRELEVEGR